MGLDMNPRTWCRLRKGSMLPPSLAGADATTLASTGPPRIVSILVASRPSTWRRRVSSSDRTRMNPKRQKGQHDERVHAAAGQDAIGNLEQIDRHRQHEQVDEDRENADGDEGAQRDLVPLLDGFARRRRCFRGRGGRASGWLVAFGRGGTRNPGAKGSQRTADAPLRVRLGVEAAGTRRHRPSQCRPVSPRRLGSPKCWTLP